MKKSVKLGIIAIVCISFTGLLFYTFEIIQDTNIPQTIQNQEKNESVVQDEKTNLIYSEDQRAKEIFSKCYRDSNCMVDAFMEISQTESKETVLSTFESIKMAYAKSDLFCHSVGHHLGEFLYGFTGNFSQSFLLSDNTCGGSIYHGIILNYFNTEIFFEDKKPEDFKPTEICKIFEDKSLLQERWNCAHGTGHGLSIAYNYDVIEAVKRCEEFETKANFLGCNEGVFMESFQKIISDVKKSANGNLFLPCDLVDEKYATECYIYHGSYIIVKNKANFADSFVECDIIKPEKFIGDCYFGVGKQGVVYHYNNLTDYAKICEDGKREFESFCIKGSAYTFAEQFGIEKSIEYCEIVNESLKGDCYMMVGNRIYQFQDRDEQILENCSNLVNPEYIESCQRGFLERMKSFESKTSHKT